LAGGAKLDGLQSNDVLAYSPTDEKSRAVLFADGSVQRVRRDEFSALTNRRQSSLELAENSPGQKLAGMPATLAVAAPAPGEPAGAGGAVNEAAAAAARSVSGVVSTTGEFASAASSHNLMNDKSSPAQNATAFKTEAATNTLQSNSNNFQRFVQAATAKNPPVLASFEVRQNGNAISVVDRDGSIYSGTLQPVELALQDDLSKAKETADKPAFSETVKKDLGVVANAQPPAQNYFFRVAGANRSL